MPATSWVEERLQVGAARGHEAQAQRRLVNRELVHDVRRGPDAVVVRVRVDLCGGEDGPALGALVATDLDPLERDVTRECHHAQLAHRDGAGHGRHPDPHAGGREARRKEVEVDRLGLDRAAGEPPQER
ncbi:MAG: hypothetical protein IPK07_24520 [Deltaproteobacteria bacterium]|nr:hypothetical protein [Deltaproteobacteria bacterium]